MKLSKLNRDVHRWGSILTALPIVVITVTGVILQLKKDVAWVQPPTAKGAGAELKLSFDEILTAAKSSPEAGFQSWDDIDRLDDLAPEQELRHDVGRRGRVGGHPPVGLLADVRAGP